jgi:ATP-binding cassette subfamily B protein
LADRQPIPDEGTRALSDAPRSDIRFDGVKFRYLPDEPVLNGLTFHVDEGQTVALVGYTGAGKTTITSLLTRMWDIDGGSIRYGGVDLREFRLDSLRGGIQSVLQDVFLFNGTIYDNIDLGRGLPLERIEEVCRHVQAHDFIVSLPKGYQTELNEGATNISAGQRQLLSFARVLAQDPRVLILDEATANIDTETEVLIQKALGELLSHRTSLVIAHRLSTIRQANKILVLDQGRIAEEGTHDELMAKQGFYYNLYKLQYEKKGATVE